MRFSAATLALLLCLAPSVSAEDMGISAGYLHQLRQQAQFRIVQGEIVCTGLQQGGGQWESRTSGSGNEERLAFNTTGRRPTIQYERRTPIGEFTFSCENGSSFTIRRNAVGASTVVPMEFKQDPGGGVQLSVTNAGTRETYRAASVWHLLLAEPTVCRRYLLPVLTPLRDRWPLETHATELEAILFRTIAAPQSDRQAEWSDLVNKLGAEDFAVRKQADRRLREAGQNVLPFLRGLDYGKLDAEQRHRLRLIVTSLTGDGLDDHPERIAGRLVGDPHIWVGMLSREDVAKRRAASARLDQIVGEKLGFDADAEISVRQAQLTQIKARLAKRPSRP
jgi:hypothetical protein